MTLVFVLAGIVWVFPVMGQQNQDKVKRVDGSAITSADACQCPRMVAAEKDQAGGMGLVAEPK